MPTPDKRSSSPIDRYSEYFAKAREAYQAHDFYGALGWTTKILFGEVQESVPGLTELVETQRSPIDAGALLIQVKAFREQVARVQNASELILNLLHQPGAEDEFPSGPLIPLSLPLQRMN